ncbi:MAG: hypothetical protein JJV97_01590 [SAR324 cluster bacterium]|nr:hypothetical protein [SAR324 cluster bacterium]
MGEILISEKSFKVLLLATMAGALFLLYFFYNQLFYQLSYLLMDNKGGVFRKISQHHLFNINFSGLIYALTSLAGLIIFWFYLFSYPKRDEIERKLMSEVVKSKEMRVDDNNVFYGKGVIDDEAVKEFVNNYNESALKFIFHRNIDGTDLDNFVKNLYREWSTRGMTEDRVRAEVVRVLETDLLDERNLYEIMLKLREVTHGVSRDQDI